MSLRDRGDVRIVVTPNHDPVAGFSRRSHWAESLAQEFDWKTIREVTCRLLEDEMAVGGPESAGRTNVVEKIRAIPPAADPDQDFDNRYTALVWTIARASYSQLRSRLSRKKPGTIQ